MLHDFIGDEFNSELDLLLFISSLLRNVSRLSMVQCTTEKNKSACSTCNLMVCTECINIQVYFPTKKSFIQTQHCKNPNLFPLQPKLQTHCKPIVRMRQCDITSNWYLFNLGHSHSERWGARGIPFEVNEVV